MKKLVICASLFALYAAPSFAAAPSSACAAKQANIEAQIVEAKARGQKQEVAGLEKALRENKAHCSDASLAKEREGKILSAKQKVVEREKDLREAEQKGDAKKIAKRKAKLDEARQELLEAEKPLN
ncbi:DUF1090 domain-containing protein [Deefgea rivuli]|uniref:DUF1090 domain-containing protein n=1 Tax=Deefgea rivuli TaxID=400948 RepID=UPI000485FA93|nr:DUF1090 domain-containing protein [Deefgea rivuli]